MKTKFPIIALYLITAFTLSACVKRLPLKVDPNANVNATLTELTVDENFNWETTSIIAISIQTQDNTGNAIPHVKVSIYSDFINDGGKEIISGYSNEAGLFELNYRVPSSADTLVISTDYVGFPDEVKIPIVENQLSFIFGGLPGNRDDEPIALAYKNTSATQITLYYLGTWKRDGTPRYLVGSDVIDATFLADINAALPENQPVPEYHPNYLWEIYEQNINLIADADVWITFVSEGAGYLNTLAYYTFDKNNPPQTVNDISEATVIFPNVSFKNSGGGLYSGDKVFLGNFPAGTSLGWLLITDGFDEASRTVTDGFDYIFSHENLNPETDPLYQQHVVLLQDDSREKFIISFEDLIRPGGDNDFNDAIFYATVDPTSAVEAGFFPIIGVVDPDTDNDGVPDSFDEFPEDAEAAFNSYYPSEGDYATLAFEDLWPSKGDYDFNDLVVDYNFNTITNLQNQVTKLKGEFVVRAIGAGFHNGFGFQLENVLSNQISSVTGNALEEGYIQSNANGTEANQSLATIIVFDDAWNHGYGNTDPSKAFAAPTETIQVEITLATPIPFDQFGLAPFNPFIIVNKERGREIHMADYHPTDLADVSYFGRYNDDTNPTIGKYYKTTGNLPWVLNIPQQFEYPIEKSSIDKPHLKFVPWVESSGSLFNDWYKNQAEYRNPIYIY
ncbi:MAG: LruC domain-containing protein [Bacteroidales bacterium]|nr:LruC domain-containing protein [Bacteroidales bacterium]